MPLISLGRADPITNGVPGKPGVQGVRTNLKTFREKVNDFARPYLFQIDIPSIDDSSQSLTMLAKSTILPPMSVEDKGFEFQGAKFKMAGTASFEDWNVTFFADEYHKLRHKFLAWQSLIYDPIRQISFTAGSYKKDDIKVIQLSKDGDVVSAYTFFGLYPSRIGEIQLDQGSKDIETFTVTFAYDYFIIDTSAETSKGYSPDAANISMSSYKYDENRNTAYDEYATKDNKNKVRSPETLQKGDKDYHTRDNAGKINGAETLLKDKAGNPEVDYNGRGKSQPSSTISVPSVLSSPDSTKIKHQESLLQDKAGNADVDYNGKGSVQKSPAGFLASQLKKLSPFPLGGDINTPDPATFLDYANWMNFRYSPPIGFRLRKYLGKDINDKIDKFHIPDINPYAWTGLQKPK